MRKFLAVFGGFLFSISSSFVIFSPAVWAQSFNDSPQRAEEEGLVAQPTFPEANVNRVGNKVTLRTLDKITATTRDFTVPVGESLKFGTLTIDVKHCEVKPPESIPETFAFVQIFEPPQDRKTRTHGNGSSEPVKLFSGWMLASKPAVSALEHGVYDVWVVGCQGGAII